MAKGGHRHAEKQRKVRFDKETRQVHRAAGWSGRASWMKEGSHVAKKRGRAGGTQETQNSSDASRLRLTLNSAPGWLSRGQRLWGGSPDTSWGEQSTTRLGKALPTVI